LFVAKHKWKKEDFKTVTRKVIEALQQIPKGMTNCYSYVKTEMDGAYCVWQAEKADDVKKFLTKKVPEMETKVTPVVQFFPPNADLYGIMHGLVS
jgi:hypothetical protein